VHPQDDGADIRSLEQETKPSALRRVLVLSAAILLIFSVSASVFSLVDLYRSGGQRDRLANATAETNDAHAKIKAQAKSMEMQQSINQASAHLSSHPFCAASSFNHLSCSMVSTTVTATIGALMGPNSSNITNEVKAGSLDQPNAQQYPHFPGALSRAFSFDPFAQGDDAKINSIIHADAANKTFFGDRKFLSAITDLTRCKFIYAGQICVYQIFSDELPGGDSQAARLTNQSAIVFLRLTELRAKLMSDQQKSSELLGFWGDMWHGAESGALKGAIDGCVASIMEGCVGGAAAGAVSGAAAGAVHGAVGYGIDSAEQYGESHGYISHGAADAFNDFRSARGAYKDITSGDVGGMMEDAYGFM